MIVEKNVSLGEILLLSWMRADIYHLHLIIKENNTKWNGYKMMKVMTHEGLMKLKLRLKPISE